MDRRVVDLVFLDKLRGIAQEGLHYARASSDRRRYQRLMHLATSAYAGLSGLPPEEIGERFTRDLGYPTAKVGVDAAVFHDGDAVPRLLLIRRADSGRWALPGGWIDPGETAERALAREVVEETGVMVVVRQVIAVNSQLPQPGSSPHTSIHLLYRCEVTAGTPHSTAEAAEAVYQDPRTVNDWHGDHGRWAEQAVEWLGAGRER
jgi:ADP-ribose pyrophosphatase YjhB (NUDIX family)